MVIDKIRKMSIKGVKLKSESFFSISPGVLELWRKNLRGADSPPPVQIGLKELHAEHISVLYHADISSGSIKLAPSPIRRDIQVLHQGV